MTEKTNATVVDLANFDTAAASDKGAELELLHPLSKAPLGVFIKLVGKDSEAFRDHVKNDVNSRLRKEHNAKRRGKEADITTAEQIEDNAIELLTVCTIGWRTGDKPILTMHGKDLPFNAVNVAEVYREMLWVRSQVDDFIGDLENFTLN